jgi:shikimate dehydrogenase
MSPPRACVIGWPVEHSRSPLIHCHWLERYNLAGAYEKEAVPPESLAAFLSSLRQRGYVGANVTLPHKERTAALVDRRTETAAKVCAVNTLWFEGSALVGDNTDVHGFLANLDERAPGWDSGGPALVLGAGGAARAIVHAVLERSLTPVWLLNRTESRAQELGERYGPAVRPGPLGRMTEALRQARLVVNTTSAGLSGAADLPVDWKAARDDAIVADVVYAPLVTAFLKAAAARGLVTVDGLGMLLHQAVPGFERWFGHRPRVDEELRQLVLRDLGV